jgi:hypothetical protein
LERPNERDHRNAFFGPHITPVTESAFIGAANPLTPRDTTSFKTTRSASSAVLGPVYKTDTKLFRFFLTTFFHIRVKGNTDDLGTSANTFGLFVALEMRLLPR